MKPRATAILLALLWALSAGMALAGDRTVTIGYQLVYNPWKVAMARKVLAKQTGYRVSYRRFDSPGKLLPALASGQVQIGLLGSTGLTAAVSRGLNLELVWVGEVIAGAEALVAREGSGVIAPQDLKGKRIGAPFVSTTHFHLLFALEQFGIKTSEVNIMNLTPSAIVRAWEAGDLDAAFVWGPALSAIKKSGRVLITSGTLAGWGKPTFDGVVVKSEWARANPEFMKGLVKVADRYSAMYRADPRAWVPGSPWVADIVKMAGGNPADVPGALAGYIFPGLAEQAGCAWLGCGPKGGAARALASTADFLYKLEKIPNKLPDYSRHVNPKWARMALADGAGK